MAASLAAAPACGGGGEGGSGGSGGSSSSASTGGGGPCVPWGTWDIQYTFGNQTCAPTNDVLTVSPGPNDGTVEVAFEGDETMPMSTCGGMVEPGTYTATATVSADGCTLTIETSTSYCYSGEDQCESRDLTLEMSGDGATGSLTYERCWCPDFGAPPATGSAKATRKTM